MNLISYFFNLWMTIVIINAYSSLLICLCCLRPYHVENTGSRPITEVKQRRARSVLGWVTAWEYRVLQAFHFAFLSIILLYLLYNLVKYCKNIVLLSNFYTCTHGNSCKSIRICIVLICFTLHRSCTLSRCSVTSQCYCYLASYSSFMTSLPNGQTWRGGAVITKCTVVFQFWKEEHSDTRTCLQILEG